MEKYRKILLLAVKIGLGSSIAIYIAQTLHLNYAVSAGTVTLLTLMTSKWQTIRLSIARLITFITTLLMVWIIFPHINSMWIAYGILLTLVVLIAESFGWRTTISVNAVAAAHLLTNQDYSAAAIWNEFLLVLPVVVGKAISHHPGSQPGDHPAPVRIELAQRVRAFHFRHPWGIRGISSCSKLLFRSGKREIGQSVFNRMAHNDREELAP